MTVFLRQWKLSKVSGWLRHTSPLLSAAPTPLKVHSQKKRRSHPINVVQCGLRLPSVWRPREGRRDPHLALPNLRRQHALAISITSEHTSNLQIPTVGESALAELQHQMCRVLPRTLKHGRGQQPQPTPWPSLSPRTPHFPLPTHHHLLCSLWRGTQVPLHLHQPCGPPLSLL
jgi:hypothetical protein